MSAKEPIAIVTSEGGMKCAYSAGALVSLARVLKVPDPDIFVAASGSTASMFYYLTHQYAEIERAWTRFMASRGIIRFLPFPEFDLDYLVNVVFRELMPLDEEALAKTPARWFVPVTDADTGLTRFVTNDIWFDPYEVMRAAKAIPFFSAGGIYLGGHRFLDGGIGTDVTSLVKKAMDEGAKRILLLTNVSPSWGNLSFPVRLYARTRPKALRALLEADLAHIETFTEPAGVKIVHVSPTYPLPAGLITRSKRKVAESFHMGYDDLVAKRAEIEELFNA